MTEQNPRPHLQARRDDWETATEEELVDALLDRPAFIDPGWMNWLERNRPQALRRYLGLHRDLGGYIGPPAHRFLRTGRSRR